VYNHHKGLNMGKPSKTSTFSINGASDALGRDRRTIGKALKAVPPDAREGGHPRWKLPTILAALESHERNTGQSHGGGSYGGGGDRNDIADELERVGALLDAGCKRLSAEPDLTKRRQLAESVGPLVGRLSRAFSRSHEMLPVGERELVELGSTAILRGWVVYLLELCEWSYPPLQANRPRAERDER
jgi:hypothetical protein